jgi:CheY-like chemotaxis protein
LAFSRKQVLQRQVFDLNTVVADVNKMLSRLIGEDIELVTLLAPNPSWVKADPSQLEQVLINLAVNARDAMPDGGKLIIETANIHLDQEYTGYYGQMIPGEYVLLTVSDTGVGLTEEVKAHLFEPFFTTKELGKGTGLGLATCFGIISQSEGYIQVYSEPGQGTTFKIYLPRVEAEVASSPAKQDEAGDLPRGTETILLVEDESEVRNLAALTLREQGYILLEAANGEEALRVAEEQVGIKLHLLITDVVMPQLGGKGLADRLSALHPDLKVLFMSGYADNLIVHYNEILAPGIAFLQKPFTLELLVRKVREVLDKAK